MLNDITVLSAAATAWDRAVDIADIVTALCASLAVILATWLGLKAIRVAKADNGQAQQEFLYKQVDSVLESALSLTSEANGVDLDPKRRNNPDFNEDQRPLERCAEAFEQRIRVMKALKLIPTTEDTAEQVPQFATALVRVALARQELFREGRGVLAPSIFDGKDEMTGVMLADLGKRVYGYETYEDQDGYIHEGDDGRHGSIDFRGDPNTALELRNGTKDPSWSPTINQSLRLVMPWIRVKLGFWFVWNDEDDHPIDLRSTVMEDSYFDHKAQQEFVPQHELHTVEEWIDAWPNRFWANGDNGTTMPPEDMVDQLLTALTSEFLDRVLALVTDLREDQPDIEKVEHI